MSELKEETIAALRAQRAAEAVRTAVDGALAELDAVPADAEKIRQKLVGDLDAVRQLDLAKVGTDFRDGEVERVANAAGAAAARLRASAQDAARVVVAWREAQPSTAGDVNERLLAEMQEQRAWARLRPQLDAGANVRSLIAAAEDAADVASLSALRAEFPAWASAADAPVPTRAVVSAIADAVLATAPKEQRAVLLVDRRLADGTTMADRALASLEAAVSAYGAFVDNPGPLDKAVRVADVRARATVQTSGVFR